MKFRALGRTGLAVSEIGFGCGTTADLMISASATERREAVEAALSLGINYFDTAPGYGAGASEINLGHALQELGARPVLATKVALEAADFGDVAGAVVRSVETSVQRLGMPVTLIQLHNRVGLQRAAKAEFGTGALLAVDDVLGPGGVVEAFESLRARGLVRFFGCSSYGGDMGSVHRLINSGRFDAIIVSYSMLNQTAWKEGGLKPPLRDYGLTGLHAAAAGMGTIALRVLEAGVLAAADPLQGGTANAERIGMAAQAVEVRRLAEQGGTPCAQVAMRFALSNEQVSVMLVGFSQLRHIEEAASSSRDGPLSGDMLERIETLRLNGFSTTHPSIDQSSQGIACQPRFFT